MEAVPTDLCNLSNVDNNVVKELWVINWSPNKCYRYYVNKYQSLKHRMIQTNMVLTKRLRVFGLLNWSRRLIVIQKLQRLKTRYVVLLVSSVIGCHYKFAKIESKRPNVINLSTKAVLNQKLQRLEIKYLILPLLLLLLIY